MAAQEQRLQTRVEQGRVYLSSVPQEERKQAPTRRESLGSRLRAFRHARAEAREERRKKQVSRDIERAERLREQRLEREMREYESTRARRRLERERRARPSRIPAFLLGKPKRRRARRTARKLRAHKGQHSVKCPPCNIYRARQFRKRRFKSQVRRLNR